MTSGLHRRRQSVLQCGSLGESAFLILNELFEMPKSLEP